MADRDGLKLDEAAQCIAEYMDYPWVHMPEQGRNSMRELACKVMGFASPQPTPHAIDLSALRRFAVFEREDGIYEDHTGSYVLFRDVQDLLAQPAAVEPAKPVLDLVELQDELWREHIRVNLLQMQEAANLLQAGLFRSGMEQAIEEFLCRIYKGDFQPAAPSPAVAEPARKAIDAQGAEVPHSLPLHGPIKSYEVWWKNNPESVDEKVLYWLRVGWNSCVEAIRSGLQASPLPAATLGKADINNVVRDTSGETWMGMRAIGYVWDDEVDARIFAGGKLRKFATHWSTGPDRAERVYRESDVRALLDQQPAASDVRDAVTVEDVSKLIDEHLRIEEWQGALHIEGRVDFIDALIALQSTPAVQADEGDKS